MILGGFRPILSLVPTLALALVLAGAARAGTTSAPEALCDAAARTVARETGVPLAVLRAITRTETGRGRGGTLQPWPWTVNMQGAGHWFDSRAEALAYATRRYGEGARSFDIGCFQINYRWHGQHFASIDAMFDPVTNGRYAASFLQDLFDELGDWTLAAGAFHSRNETHAAGYRQRFAEIRASLPADNGGGPGPGNGGSGGLLQPAAETVVLRVNTYPLLQRQSGGGTGALGSLVPMGGNG